MNNLIKFIKSVFADTRCLIALLLVIHYCIITSFHRDQTVIASTTDLVKMVLCFYFGVRSSMRMSAGSDEPSDSDSKGE